MLESGDFASEPQTISTADGDLSYATAGSGPPVLAIQGVGVIGRGWQPQVTGLSARFRILTFDNRGVGRSPRGDRRLTIERMAADALAIADAERLDRFHVLGHSMGGLIALHLALTSRDRVKSLALHLERLSRDLGDLFGRDLADQPPIIQHQLRAMSRYSAMPRLHELSGIPTLVSSARHDPIAPPSLGREIASHIDGARYVEFSEASHALPIQLAREVNALLLEHLVAAETGRAAAPDVTRAP